MTKTPPNIPKNTYTYAPQQHPNLILGSLHLLFWLVFCPSAWKNHIYNLAPSRYRNFSLSRLFTSEYRKNLNVWRFIFQSLFLLPIITGIASSICHLGLQAPFDYVWRESIENIGIGIALGLISSLLGGVVYGTALGVAGSIVGLISTDFISGITFSIACGIAFGGIGSVVYGRLFGGVFGLALALVFSAIDEMYLGIAFGTGMSINWWRPILMSIVFAPWHALIYSVDQSKYKYVSGAAQESQLERPHSLLHKHIAFWDEWQYLPILGVDKHLLLVLEENEAEGQAALEHLDGTSQRWAALSAYTEFDARKLEDCDNVIEISQIHQNLVLGDFRGSGDILFRSLKRISEDVAAAIAQTSAYNQRLAFNTVSDRLDGLIRELTRSKDKSAVRFRPIAQRWSNIVALKLEDLTQAAELRQEIDSPYIIGVPLTERQAIFVGRTDISARIEQLLLDRRRPPLLLYGQRRTGKTSLLNNLGRLLPNSIIPLFVDLQGPASRASDHTGFLYNLAKGMADSAKRQRGLALPSLSRDALADDPFTRFDEWLDEVEILLEDNTALLALDEFEVLDQALVEGRFSETAILGMLRNLIQHRPRFKVLLSGSHTLEEFQRWSSYLINAQVLHLGYLQESEARQLIEHPVKDFALRYEPDASQRVLDLTHGHPFLVQLLCAEIVVLKNEQAPSIRRLATLADVEAAIPEALSSGSMFFSDIERNQITPPTLAVLRYLAAQGEGATVSQPSIEQAFPEGVEEALQQLLRRELIETTPEGYRIQVKLIRRWFHQ